MKMTTDEWHHVITEWEYHMRVQEALREDPRLAPYCNASGWDVLEAVIAEKEQEKNY